MAPVANVQGAGSHLVRASRLGRVVDGQVVDSRLDLSLLGGMPIYGMLIVWEQTIAAVTSATADVSWLKTSIYSGLHSGAVTSYLTGETLTLIPPSNNSRCGISDTISLGLHTLVIQWDGVDRYRWRLDGADATELHTSPSAPLQTVGSAGEVVGILGRSYSGDPRACFGLIAIAHSAEVDLRDYERNPWALCEPQAIYVPRASAAAGYTHPTLSNARMIWTGLGAGKPAIDYTW